MLKGMRRVPLLWQIIAINALLVAATIGAAVVTTGFDFGVASGRGQFAVLALGTAGILLGNGLLLRRRLQPLDRLIKTMESVDLSAQGRRAELDATDSVEVARLNASFNRMLDRLETERRAASQSVLRAQEQERKRLAQDLHDEVNQALTAIMLRLQASIQDAPPDLAGELRETQRLAGQAMEELLNLARELRPTALDDHGLLPALRAQVRDFGERTGIHADFRRRGEVPPLSDDQQLVIYRVAQESLSNVVQHAEARHVTVELSFVGRTVLRIADDGCGVSGERNGGLGLRGMEERALLVGGDLDVHSADGRGTTVTLTMS
ncbi:MAG: two-component system, NarL family, sensor histidine kinase UhpB [Solirubrobacteraceae bacterium]|jgi:two-component system sensor histidine kinase UhpB|nr:two-component system, NarL family, sensor histidine kinase UhpB [Solirubrobacteraceae bacterium]